MSEVRYEVPRGAMWLPKYPLVVPTYAMFFEECRRRDIGPDFLAGRLAPEQPTRTVPKPPSRKERTTAAIERAKTTTWGSDHVAERPWAELYTKWCQVYPEAKGRCYCGRPARSTRLNATCSEPCHNHARYVRRLDETCEAKWAFLTWLWGEGVHYDYWETPEYHMLDTIWELGAWVLDQLNPPGSDLDSIDSPGVAKESDARGAA
jgi:hypothetical protein